MSSKRQSPEHITIVMATRNGAAHLDAQLASIARQSHRNWTLFVSDDGSSDGTRALIEDFARAHPVRLVAGPCQGAAQNFLSALCHPNLPEGMIALADQDDVWLDGKLARGLRQIGAIGAGARPVLYGAEAFLANRHLRPFSVTRSGATRPGFGPSLAQNLFAGHTILLNGPARDLVRRAGIAPEIAHHDWWLYQLVAGAGGALILDPMPTVIYRQHGQNHFGAARGLRAARQRLRKLASGEWREVVEAHVRALESCSALLDDEARALLHAFRNAPSKGAARVRSLRQLGIRRSSGLGDLCMATAALFGRV